MSAVENYNHKVVEKKWQKYWKEQDSFKFDENNSQKEKYYVLEMFPFPSGKIHMGHLRNYAIGDGIARFKKLQNFNVLHPMGFDAFGLPAENAALQNKIHPKEWTYSNIDNMTDELKTIGFSYDWNRKFATCDVDYYKHEQKIFLDFLKNDLVYQKESFVNWDPIDQTVLANEQVIDGRGWRSGALVEKKKLKQWFLRVSDFSEELLAELENLTGWDKKVLTMQEKWIGKSEGALIDFEIDLTSSQEAKSLSQNSIRVYTTRPETIFGASFIGISANHPIANELAKNNPEIANFIEECNKNAVDEATLEKTEKKGLDTGIKIQHPFDENIKLPLYIANFVLMDYGTGAIFACPAHDQRDFEFATKYNLQITQVVGNLDEFLEETPLINFSDKNIQNIINKIKSEVTNANDEVELTKAAYNFVLKDINHVMDNDKYLEHKPYLKASEVLENEVGFCFGKSNLFCAILRGMNIPCGFSDQLLMLDEDISDKQIIHNLNAVYLKTLKKWIRLDSRGENAKFSLEKEILAYEARKEFNEIDNLRIYPKISQEITNLYEKSANNSEIIENLFSKNSYELKEAYSEDGIMINSSFLDGLTNQKAKEKIINLLEEQKIGERKINYRLRDWGISRQRYWGCPIPVMYDEEGNAHPIDEKDLPVTLPDDVTFENKGNPLNFCDNWKNITKNGKKFTRETDTFDTFFESSWYFLRFASQPENKAFDKEIVNKILSVDQYIGGVEHAVLHLLYARFFTKALKKCGYLDFNEPFKNLLTQGMVCHQTFKDEKGDWVFPYDVVKNDDGELIHYKTKEKITAGRSEKMSKSKKNVVEPANIISAYGADTARLFMLSDSPVEKNLEWSDSGIDGCFKYINRLWKLVSNFVNEGLVTYDENEFFDEEKVKNFEQNQQNIIKLTHKTINLVEQNLEKIAFNVVIAKIREFSNELEKFTPKNEADKKVKAFALNNLVLLISPIIPHLTEELWFLLGNKNAISDDIIFPKFNKKLTIDDEVKIAVQVNGKLRVVLNLPKDSAKEDVESAALNDENVIRNLDGKNIKKVIYVPNKLVNVVAK